MSGWLRNSLLLIGVGSLLCIIAAAGCHGNGGSTQGDVESTDPNGLLALPAAEGFGAQSVGGRGGTVLYVTTLEEHGAGSLRACIEASGPRVCVFRIGGTIEMLDPLDIVNPFLTVAGQTAPGDGITIKSERPINIGLNAETDEGGLVATHDIILQHLRFRRSIREDVTPENDNSDALTVLAGSHDIMIDHCSFSWGTDETLSITSQAYNITVQWSIVSESYFKGLLVSRGARNITIHHTLFAHNPERNAKLKGRPEELEGNDAIFDFVNNVVYNWRDSATAVAGSGMANVVSNYYKLGPETTGYPIPREIARVQDLEVNGISVRSIFAEDNVGPTCPEGCVNNDWDNGMVSDIDGNLGNISRSDTRIAAPPVTTSPAAVAFDDVLATAGASLGLDEQGALYFRRDAVDEHIIQDVRNGTGTSLDSVRRPDTAWPRLATSTPYADTDRDGMADLWEQANGLDPGDASDNNLDLDRDGYTNLEEFLNASDPNAP